jgi:hypothetical protein
MWQKNLFFIIIFFFAPSLLSQEPFSSKNFPEINFFLASTLTGIAIKYFLSRSQWLPEHHPFYEGSQRRLAPFQRQREFPTASGH